MNPHPPAHLPSPHKTLIQTLPASLPNIRFISYLVHRLLFAALSTHTRNNSLGMLIGPIPLGKLTRLTNRLILRSSMREAARVI